MKSAFILFLGFLCVSQITAIYTTLNKNEQFCVYKTFEATVSFTGSYVVSGETEDLISLRVFIQKPQYVNS
jgi:hypothetical protein